MPKYQVVFTYVDSGEIEVEAESENAAIGYAQREVSTSDADHRDSFFDAYLIEESRVNASAD